MTNLRCSLLTWSSPFLVSILLTFLLAASVGRGQSSNLTCQLSAFFSFDGSDKIGDLLKTEGRGLLSCKNDQGKNDQGFLTELPVFVDLEARVVKDLANSGELSFSANSSVFVVPREVGQLQDRYEVRQFSWNDPSAQNPTVLFRGDKHDLVIEMRLTSSTQALSRIEITGLQLRFDDSAPTLSTQ